MVSPINSPGLPRSNLDSRSITPQGQGQDLGAKPGAAGDQPVLKPATRTIRTPEDAINVMKARLFQRLEQYLGKGSESASGASNAGEQGTGKGLVPGAERTVGSATGSAADTKAAQFSSPAFEAPSAKLVAQRVLGYVQQRLLAEARAGADAERLTGLLAQAKAGIIRGFAEARDQIEVMDLMKDELSLEIDDSFNRIQTGLDDLLDRLVKPQLTEQPQLPQG